MKKIVFTLVLLFSAISMSAQSPDKFMNMLSSEDNVVNVEVGGFLMNMIRPFITVQVGDLMPRINGIKSIHVLTSEGCSGTKKNDYISMINNLKDIDGYETIVQVRDDNDHVRVMMKTEEDQIKGIYVFCVDETDIAAIKLLGNIKEKDVQKVIKKYSKND